MCEGGRTKSMPCTYLVYAYAYTHIYMEYALFEYVVYAYAHIHTYTLRYADVHVCVYTSVQYNIHCICV